MLPLANLKFQDVIGFYQANNDAVYKDLKTAYLGGRLTPFVGAGLSVFCGYKLWPNVLKELSAFIPDEEPKQEALEMIDRFKYLEAAEHIQKHYRPMLRRLQGIVSYDKLEVCPTERLYSSAAWVLPYLFHNRPLMTTNFDGVLEYVFSKQGSTFERVVEPHDPSLLTQLRQQDIHGLFKLHGDIGRETASLDRLVFTKSQYDDAYCEDDKLMKELKQWYQNQTLLFLGCSLAMDKTMEVLQDVVSTNPGIRHFAIVGCKKEQRSELLDRFIELGIDAIFYDDSNHDAVRVILERLLEETDSTGYKQLCRSCRSMVPATEEKRPLMFDSEYFPFSGRKEELARLAEFCEAEDQLLWCAVTGPGGMGKSRLVFEFCNTMRTQGWQIQRFEANPSRGSEAHRLEELSGWMPEVGKTIVVLDDVQAYMDSVCAWMTRMDRNPRSEELRILLLEREGKTIQDSSWMGPDFKNSHLDELCHREGFLCLKPMTDDQLMSVMTDYAKAAGKTLNAELLLKTLERVDPEFKRPLYAVAIADTRCQGKDPTNWNRDKILDTLLDRELKFHLDRLQGIDGRKPGKAVCSELERLLAEACIRGFLPLDHVDWAAYKFLSKRMEDTELEAEDFCKRLGILQTAEVEKRRVDQYGHPIDDLILKEEAKVILPSCPDLLKEHLVLKLALEKKTLELLPDGWHLDPNRLSFLLRLWINYPNRLKDEAAFWDRFFSAPSASGVTAWLYGELLWGSSGAFPALSQRAVDALTRLYHANTDDKKIAKCYANGLYNLACDQPSENRGTTMELLKNLYDAHSENAEVVVPYAKSLFNLSCDQSLVDRAANVDRLEELYKAHSENTEVVATYAKYLRNLACNQPYEDCASIVDQLGTLYNKHFSNNAIAMQYAMGLCVLSRQQTPEERVHNVEILENICGSRSDWQDVVDEYAAILGNLAYFQTTKTKVQETFDRSQSVLEQYSYHTDIQFHHAQTWFNLTLVQDESDIPATVSEIAAFLRDHPDAIPEFREALDKYLFEHPDHTARYQPLLELGGDGHA